MKSLLSFIDTPAVRELEEFYGPGLQKLTPSTRMAIIAALGAAAHAVTAVGVSEGIDDIFGQLIADLDDAPPSTLWELLHRLDQQLDDPLQAIALVAGIAEGLAYASV